MEPSSNFAYLVLKKLQENSDRNILVVDKVCVTRRQLHEKITAAINLLRWKGISANDRVLMTISPSVDFYAVAIAVLAVGGSLVIIDPHMGIERCDHCIATAKPSMWVWKKGSKFRFLNYVLPALCSTPLHLEIRDLDLPSTSQELFAPSEVEPVDHALVTFTTGSTGLPKLLLRRHSFLLNQTHSLSIAYETAIKKELGMEEEEAVYCTNLSVFPLHFMKVGSLCLLYPSIDNMVPSEVMKTLKKYDCTALSGSPAFVEKLAAHAQKNNTTLPVKYSGVGGAPVYRGTLRTISSVTPERRTVVIYGSTEAEPISMIFAEEKQKLELACPDGLCVGKPVMKGSVKVIRIRDDAIEGQIDISSELELPPNEIGELIISGWHVNTYQVSSNRLLTDQDGVVWLRIEDAGYLDEEGRVWLVGRVKWRVEKHNRIFWSTVVEQKMLDRCSLITFATYLSHKGEAWLFLEAPKGLPDKEKAGIKSFLTREGIPTDHLEIRAHIPRDRRHRSKPDTAALFKRSNPNSPFKIIVFLVKSNPLKALVVMFVQILLIMLVLGVIITQ